MGLGDMAKKAKDALSSEKGEQVSDNVLDRGADLANRATGGKYADKIEQGRNAVDQRVGTEGSAGADRGTDGVNAVGTAAGSGQTSGTTTAGATSPGPEDAAGRHRADGDPDSGGPQNPGASKHRA